MIETKNLKLIPCELKHFEPLLRDQPQFEQMFDVKVTDGWLEFPEAFQLGYEYLKANPTGLVWWTYLFVHTVDNVLIGNGGFKGVADKKGMVEIGYEIAPTYRNRGLATEVAQGLVNYAFSHPQIKMVDAHTLAEANPSASVLEKVGMRKIETVHDLEYGKVWHWRLVRRASNSF